MIEALLAGAHETAVPLGSRRIAPARVTELRLRFEWTELGAAMRDVLVDRTEPGMATR
jgi:NAD dependent epimerase/dehydratase family enzyme